ncbi:ferredoxin [Candidatus Pacearchaeota archaeon CG10_big_fil_rev_8_21_14_0_10_35_13]|nr:MAG: ferredoxin [Candidatus Pacearchaeota archaeon CG10_big_fil_rev_8_21_14_0_10_35_13]
MAKVKVGDNSLEVSDGDSLKESCESLGVLFACEEGVCGTCEVKVLSGGNNLTPPTDAEKTFGVDIKGGKRLACQCCLKKGNVDLEYNPYG